MRPIRLLVARAIIVAIIAAASLVAAAPASAAGWVQNHTPTELWSGPDTNAITFGLAPQWDYFEVVAAVPGGRLYVLSARTGGYAFIEPGMVGPSGPPPAGWPGGPAPAATAAALQPAAIGPVPGYSISAPQGFWPALQILVNIRHDWTLQALSSTGTRLEWAQLPADAAGAYQPARALIMVNDRWSRSDPRALASVIEHEAKHVADLLAGLDVTSPAGCIATEVNAYREEAKTWGELVGPGGKPDPRDELEASLNNKLYMLQTNPGGIPGLISQHAGYRGQCRVRY